MSPTDKKTNQPAGPMPFGAVSYGKTVPGLVGPAGEPVHAANVTAAAGQMPVGKADPGVVRISSGSKSTGVQQAAGAAAAGGAGLYTPGVNGPLAGGGCADGSCGLGGPGPEAYGPMANGIGRMLGHGGIYPVPAMGVPGAVAFPAGLAGPGSGMYGPMYTGQRSSIRFANPAGMRVTWQGPGGMFIEPAPLESPARYNFAQGGIYRLRLTGIPKLPGKQYYPTLEVYPATPKTITYLSHNTVPVSFTDEDFGQVNDGNLVVKVIYLPDEKFQDIAALAGADEVVSTRLEPGVNPIDEANRRGTILAVIRIGNIDLQDPNTPAMDAPVGMSPRPAVPTTPPVTTPPMTPGTPKVPAPLPNAVKNPGVIVIPSAPVSRSTVSPVPTLP
ncbi:hypothetical protein FRUB_01125 [Fimbriiglobus ruber]|uniref:Uncharacterized protein n=2 Tax=Fimbriiglobus ruber TaxID=1908690 RepID=A0A225EBN6_9BACT|nr:hypothetical protein FRUB_01125 [Fimbriiglobus ruber]